MPDLPDWILEAANEIAGARAYSEIWTFADFSQQVADIIAKHVPKP